MQAQLEENGKHTFSFPLMRFFSLRGTYFMRSDSKSSTDFDISRRFLISLRWDYKTGVVLIKVKHCLCTTENIFGSPFLTIPDFVSSDQIL